MLLLLASDVDGLSTASVTHAHSLLLLRATRDVSWCRTVAKMSDDLPTQIATIACDVAG